MLGAPIYTVKVRPARWGFISSVSKDVLLEVDDDGKEWWMGYTPEPEFWRPTEQRAVWRALRKRNRLIAKDSRTNSVRTVK